MADPTLEEDSLISQEDIDNLLDSSTIEEAEEKLSGNDPDTVDALGELSQDDIDQLMNSNTTKPEDSLTVDDAGDDDMELISQDDIDQLMNSSVSSDEDNGAVSDDSPDDVGELSQEDIDTLLNASPQTDTSGEKPLESTPSDDGMDENFEMISQDDINRLMGGQTEATDVYTETDEKIEPESLPAEDTGGDLTEDMPVVDEISEPALKQSIREDTHVIDESEAIDVQDSLIAQETIDDLIKNFDNEDLSEPVILDEEPVTDTGTLTELADETGAVSVSERVAGSDEPEIEDAEDFLTPNADLAELDFDDVGDGDVTQDDIDALLLESDDEEEDDYEDEDDILISQDDIDTLLMAADQEDEDVLGDLMDDEFDSSMDDDFGGEDILESDDVDEEEDEEDDQEDDEDQVVLEGDDEEPVVKRVKKERSQWARSKLVIACASALVVLGITVPISYFLFFSGDPAQTIQQDPVAKLSVETQREIEVETVDINLQPTVMDKKPGNLILKDFVILASDASKEMAYITADISIDYSDQRAYHEIQDNLSFYRDLIYDSLNKSLVAEKREEITEADILWAVETTLKKVLPGQYIARVSFKSFKAS